MNSVIDEVKIQVWKFADQRLYFEDTMMWWRINYIYGNGVFPTISNRISRVVINQVQRQLELDENL